MGEKRSASHRGGIVTKKCNPGLKVFGSRPRAQGGSGRYVLHAAGAILAVSLGLSGGSSTVFAATVPVAANVTTSQTWTADNEYVLQTVIYVENGATLTIEPGTVVRGWPDSLTPGTNDPGTLVVTRGSKIFAMGTKFKPIVFTNEDDDNIGTSPGSFPYDTLDNARSVVATWGGVVVLGRGYVANNTSTGPNGAREVQIEGLTAAGSLGFYGNCAASALFPASCDDDDSGTIQYVSIRYGGFNLSPNNEINGLTLGAVGRETDVHHVEVFQNKDDGFEMFGGAVNLKNVVVVAVGDDGLDYDEGWRGKVQYAFVMQGTPGTDKSDKGGEWDGGNSPDGSQPRAIPTVYNATMVGHGQKNFTLSTENTALHFRDNAGGRVYNSAFLDFGGATVLIEGGTASSNSTNTSGERSGAAYAASSGNCSVTTGTTCTVDANCPGGEVCVLHYRGPGSTFELELEDNTFWCIKRQELLAGPSFPVGGDRPQGVMVTRGVCSGSGALCLTDAGCPSGQSCDDAPEDWGITLPGDSNKIHHDNGMFTNAALDNAYLSCASTLPIRTLTRGSAASTVPDPVVAIDPRPGTGSPLLTTNRTAPNDGFFDPVAFRGAFQGANWATKWTNMGRLGYVAACPASPSAVPDEVTGVTLSGSNISWMEPGLPGLMGVQVFDVLRSTDKTTFTAASCVNPADDHDTQGSDATLPSLNGVFYYLVRAENACGAGTLGFQSSGAERPAGVGCTP
jgi:hypothetical protein